MKWVFVLAALVVMSSHSAHATDLSCVSTTFNALSPNDKVCVSAFDDPQVPGIVCHISQARKGGWGQPLGSGTKIHPIFRSRAGKMVRSTLTCL